MAIADFLGLGRRKDRAASSAETETIRKIVAALDAMDEAQARYVAAFAFILCRVARADLDVSEKEHAAMEEMVTTLCGLPEQQAILVVQMAKTQNALFGGTDNYLVTREFNKMASREQKLSLLECLFAVSASDASISQTEDNEISRISSELQLTHEDRITARARYREHLAVLKPR